MESPGMQALLHAVTSELKRTEQTLSPRGASHDSFHDPHSTLLPLIKPIWHIPEDLFRQLHGGRLVLTRMNAMWSAVEVALGAVESIEFTKVRHRIATSRGAKSERAAEIRGAPVGITKSSLARITMKKTQPRF
jgi:hypothetical protein